MASVGPSPASPLVLTTLGGASLRTTSGVEVLSAGKPLALLIYLACAPRGIVSRTHLLDLLWSDVEPERARHALRQAIWYLRQALGADALRTSNDDLVLDTSIAVDRDRLLDAVSRGQCEEAVELYTGEFLHRFAIPGGAGFEHWADVERQRLRAAFQRAAERTVRRLVDAGRFRDAQVLAGRSRDTARADESGWRLVLETLHASGNQLGIAMESAALLKELGADGRAPEPATRALLAAIICQPDATGEGAPNPLLAELVGREQQFAHCVGAWHRVAQSRAGQHVHILAPSGYGKSRLLHDVRFRLLSLGVRCVSVRATPGQRDIPYSCASDLVAALASLPGAAGVSPATASILTALNPSLSSRYPLAGGGGSPEDALHRRSSAIAELCAVVAEEGPFALQVDDLHWVDSASRQILRTLLERIEQYACLALTSTRPGADQVTFSDATQPVSLPPLSVEQVARLLSSLGSLPVAEWARELPVLLCQSTLGSPLLILETLRLTLDRGDLRLQQGEWSCARPQELQVHLTEGRALRHRYDQLSGSEREMLLLLASAGEEIPAAQMSTATRLAEGVVLERLSALEQKGFVQRSGERWQALHDEIARESLLAATPDEQRRAHTMLGNVLAAGAARRGDYIRAARHLFLADRRRELRQVVIGYVQLVRREGDSRRVRYLVHDMLPDVDGPTVERILESLGRWNRLRYTPLRPVLIGGGTIAALLLASVALRSPQETPPDLTLMIAPEDTTIDAYQVPVRIAQFLATDRLDATRGERSLVSAPPASAAHKFSYAGDCLYYARTTGSTTTTDIFRRCIGEDEDPVYSALRDDGYPSPSPDQRRLVITTSQWSPIGADNYDLAILDLATRDLVPLLKSDLAMEVGPAWSPDGARIAFVQRLGRTTHLCLIPPVPQADYHCAVSSRGVSDIFGWINGDQLLLGYAGATGFTLVRHTVSDGRQDTLLHGALGRPALSQDGRWFTTSILVPGHSQPQWYLYRTETPAMPRLIELLGDAEEFRIIPLTHERFARTIDSLAIAGEPAPLAPGVVHQLRLTAFNGQGREVELTSPVEWSVAPAENAIVDSLGRLIPVQGSGVEVRAALPGWMASSIGLAFRQQPPQLLLHEDWGAPLATGWISYGTPRPLIVDGADGQRAFLNNGDGSYPSGAYLRKGYMLSHGLALEAEVWAPLTRTQWQTITIELCGGCDTTAMGAWDHSVGPPAFDGPRRQIRSCGAVFPSGEGPGKGDSMAFAARGMAGVVLDRTGLLQTGKRHILLLQLFADGRCGLALDGAGLVVSRAALRRDRAFHPVLSGNSVGTRMLVGRVKVWRGVRDGVDWSRAEQ
jgi:serine/threonine-protein kinase